MSDGEVDEQPATTMTEVSSDDEIDKRTYEQIAKDSGMRYTVCDIPPLLMSIILGIQHFLTMLGATVLIPLLLTSAMGATQAQTALVIATTFVVQGINTLVQTSLGDRLPIIQGGSFAYLPATFTIIANPGLQAIENNDERFLETMRVIQGAIIVVGIIQIVIGYTGLFVPMIRYIGPVTIAPVIAAIGLGLTAVGFSSVAVCFPIGLTQIAVTIIFSQYLKGISLGGYNVFALFPIVLAIAFTWSLNAILTAAGVWPEGDACRTGSTIPLVAETPVFRVPYPGQWGPPIFEAYAIVPMIGSMLAGMIESIGDYYSCAKISGAPPPTAGIIARGQAGEGWGVLVAGVFGTANGTTSYSENIGAISITRVGSRTVVQCGACVMIIVGLFTKVSAVIASLPQAIVGGMYCILFGLIVAVGVSQLQYIDLNSERNLFIVGFAIYNSMSISGPGGYFAAQGSNPFGDSNGGQIAFAIFSSPMIIALISAFFLDNTVKGSRKERGLHVWDRVRNADVNNDPEYVKVYSLPGFFAKLFHNCNYLEYASLGHLPDPPVNGYVGGRGDIGDLCCRCFLRRGRADVEGDDDDDAVVETGKQGATHDHEKMEAGV